MRAARPLAHRRSREEDAMTNEAIAQTTRTFREHPEKAKGTPHFE